MAEIKVVKNRYGEITGYRARIYLGKDKEGKRITLCKTIPRPDDMTPKKEKQRLRELLKTGKQNSGNNIEKLKMN